MKKATPKQEIAAGRVGRVAPTKSRSRPRAAKSALASGTLCPCGKPHIPNAETRKAFREADAGRGLIRCRDADDMFKKLGI